MYKKNNFIMNGGSLDIEIFKQFMEPSQPQISSCDLDTFVFSETIRKNSSYNAYGIIEKDNSIWTFRTPFVVTRWNKDTMEKMDNRDISVSYRGDGLPSDVNIYAHHTKSDVSMFAARSAYSAYIVTYAGSTGTTERVVVNRYIEDICTCQDGFLITTKGSDSRHVRLLHYNMDTKEITDFGEYPSGYFNSEQVSILKDHGDLVAPYNLEGVGCWYRVSYVYEENLLMGIGHLLSDYVDGKYAANDMVTFYYDLESENKIPVKINRVSELEETSIPNGYTTIKSHIVDRVFSMIGQTVVLTYGTRLYALNIVTGEYMETHEPAYNTTGHSQCSCYSTENKSQYRAGANMFISRCIFNFEIKQP
jgi:hypothetical protein